MSSKAIVPLAVSWRRALKRVWNLPMHTHSNILYAICGKRPIEVELRMRAIKFIFECINSDNSLVQSVTRHTVSQSGCLSPIGCNFVSCCQFFGLAAVIPDYYVNFDYLHKLDTAINKMHLYNDISVNSVIQLLELIMMRDNIFSQYTGNISTDTFHTDEIRTMINLICTSST